MAEIWARFLKLGLFVFQAQVEVERLSVLKITKMKELVLKKRLELDEVCKSAHLEPDVNLAVDKLIAVIDSGIQWYLVVAWNM